MYRKRTVDSGDGEVFENTVSSISEEVSRDESSNSGNDREVNKTAANCVEQEVVILENKSKTKKAAKAEETAERIEMEEISVHLQKTDI